MTPSVPLRRKISSTVRRQIAELAGHRCSYCRSPEWVGIPMVMEHVIPLAVGGASDSENLCLACYRCNEFKGVRVDARDPLSGDTVPLFHPGRQAWQEHFAWSEDGVHVIGRTACGRATIAALRLNNDWLVQARHIWVLAGLHPPLE